MTERNVCPTELAPGQGLATRLVAAVTIIVVGVAAVIIYVKTKSATEAGNRVLEQSAQYDMAGLQKVDPALIQWKEVARIDTGIPTARAIAVNPAGELFVGGDNVVRRMKRGGERIGDISVKGVVQALACDANGNLFVAFGEHVELYAADATPKAVFASLGGKAQITSIAVGGGNVFIADFGNRVVHACDMSGKVLNVIGREDRKRNMAGLNLPSPHMDVAVAADGTVWIANTGRWRLENYSPEGDLNRYWGEGGSAIEKFVGCCNPADFCLLADGSFVTAEKGALRVKHYLPDGRMKSVVAAAQSFPKSTIGLDVAADGMKRVLVLARGTGMVFVFEPKEGTP
ncbi:MAG: hypothetical protein ABSH20_25745 [Tepidisphaeraceae bacterium]